MNILTLINGRQYKKTFNIVYTFELNLILKTKSYPFSNASRMSSTPLFALQGTELGNCSNFSM